MTREQRSRTILATVGTLAALGSAALLGLFVSASVESSFYYLSPDDALAVIAGGCAAFVVASWTGWAALSAPGRRKAGLIAATTLLLVIGAFAWVGTLFGVYSQRPYP